MTPRVALFVTCLVDVMRPSVGFAAARLIETSGCTVEVPARQTCCGQPAFNSGDRQTAKDIARLTVEAFAGYDYVVAPSGSCAAMLKWHVPELLAQEPCAEDARDFAARTHELTAFLVNVRCLTSVPGQFAGTVAYHDACSGLRDLGIRSEPRALLASMPNVALREMSNADACCGFGGLFSVKYPNISDTIVARKTADAAAAAPDLLVSGDLGCLINIAGKMSREGRPIRCRHVAEVLAGELYDPAIGDAP